LRIGNGIDVHALVPDRDLILGGVLIPHSHGLLGHSDADVLTHAIMDALLGAAGLRDIGYHFPDTDNAYKDACSIDLLQKVHAKIQQAGFCIQNIDTTIVAQRPKLAPYLEKMQQTLANALQLDPGQISIKATTTEGLGFCGREEGIAAYAVCLLQSV
jgi:2-C-methyl-D-erythritol 2,4-cyclodiphosphate synthase